MLRFVLKFPERGLNSISHVSTLRSQVTSCVDHWLGEKQPSETGPGSHLLA